MGVIKGSPVPAFSRSSPSLFSASAFGWREARGMESHVVQLLKASTSGKVEP